jgi:hypothetical protein
VTCRRSISLIIPRSAAAKRAALSGALLVALLAGCTGDFGRPRPVLFTDDRQPSWASRLFHDPSGPVAFAGLTDDERRLRDMAYGLLRAPGEPDLLHQLTPLDIDYARVIDGPGPVLDRTDYARKLVAIPARSEEMRYARLIDDIRSDAAQLENFFATARRVADMDRRRDQSLAHVAGLNEAELSGAQARIRENGSIIARVHHALEERAAAYRYAIERLVISAPSPRAAEAERAWTELQRRIAAAWAPAAPRKQRA